MPNFISEDDIEQAMVQRLQHLYGYDMLYCLTSDPADVQDGSGRGTRGVLFHAFSSKCMKQDPTPSTVPGFRLHRLKGKDAARWSVRVSGNWRLTFEFREGRAHVIDYEDYH